MNAERPKTSEERTSDEEKRNRVAVITEKGPQMVVKGPEGVGDELGNRMRCGQNI